MIPSIQGVAVPSSTSTDGIFTVALPADMQVGERVFVVYSASRNNAATIEAGWDEHFLQGYSFYSRTTVWSRVVDGSEGASVDIDLTLSGERATALAFRTNASGVGAVGGVATNTNPSACPVITTTGPNSAVLNICGGRSYISTETDVIKPAGTLVGEVLRYKSTRSAYVAVLLTEHATAGAAGAEEFDFTVGNAPHNCNVAIELLEAAAAGPTITDVDGDNEVEDGQANVVVNLSGFSDLPAFTLKYGGFETAVLAATGDADTAAITIPDYAALESNMIGVPVGKTVKLRAYHNPAEGDPEDAEFDIVINPKAGYTTRDIVGAGTGETHVTDTAVADGSVAYFVNTINVFDDLRYQIDAYPAELRIWHSDTGITEKFTVLEDVSNGDVPSITIFGSLTPTVELGGTFPGTSYEATDTEDGNVTASVIVTGSVNMSAVGAYPIAHNFTDSDGNAAQERIVMVNVVDTTPPTVPGNVQGESTGATTATVTCDPSSDLSGIAGYKIFLNGVYYDDSVVPEYDFTGLDPETSYDVGMLAYDQYSNESALSVVDSFTTDAAPAPAPPYVSHLAAVNMDQSDAVKLTLKGGAWRNSDNSIVLPLQ